MQICDQRILASGTHTVNLQLFVHFIMNALELDDHWPHCGHDEININKIQIESFRMTAIRKVSLAD